MREKLFVLLFLATLTLLLSGLHFVSNLKAAHIPAAPVGFNLEALK